MNHSNDKYAKVKDKLYSIIFGTDTPAGKAFDVMLIIAILGNSILVIFESVDTIQDSYERFLTMMTWFFVGIFTIEYFLRIWVVKKRMAYLFSFFGIIDLLSILPIYIGVFLPNIRFLVIIRIFRLLRLFSVLKMGRYMDESSQLLRALRASKPKITVFLFTMLFIIVIVGSMMYIIEGPENGFDNIPESMYWAVVTVTTVGYGDLSPQTPLGKLLSSILMFVAYGIIAVPTGIISFELANTPKTAVNTKICRNCDSKFNSADDQFCSKCGTSLKE